MLLKVSLWGKGDSSWVGDIVKGKNPPSRALVAGGTLVILTALSNMTTVLLAGIINYETNEPCPRHCLRAECMEQARIECLTKAAE